jgi:peptidoglycan/LPS O-acetylase OafA/YrhL
MNRDTSIYLDSVRFLAALVVLISHIEQLWAPGLIPFAKYSGQLSVGVFFVLSGYVIAYAVDTKERDGRTYALNRVARVYSVVVPCLILTLTLDVIGRWLAPGFYAALGFGSWKEVAKIVISLFFVNEVWHWEMLPGSNVPFWSVAYEVPYYLIFGLWFFGRTLRCRVAAVCTLAVAGPYITLLFALWLFGFGCYGLCQTIMLNRIQARLLLVVSVVAWAPLALWSFPYWLRFFLVGIPFAGSIVGFVFAGIELSGCQRPIRWAAGTTFTLYLAHFPIGVLMQAVLPPEWPLWLRWAAITTVALAAAFLLAAFTERRKSVWRRWIAWTVARSQRWIAVGPQPAIPAGRIGPI